MNYRSLEEIYHPELCRSTPKNKVICGKLGDLEEFGINEFSILNALNPDQVVRKIKIIEDEILIDAMDNKGYHHFSKS